MFTPYMYGGVQKKHSSADMVWKKVHSSRHIIEQHLVVDNFLSFIIFIFF